MEDQLLTNVYVDVELEQEEFVVLKKIPCKSLAFNETASTYIIFQLPEEVSCLATSLTNTLKFVVKDSSAGASDPGLQDEYPVGYLFLLIFTVLGLWQRQNLKICSHLNFVNKTIKVNVLYIYKKWNQSMHLLLQYECRYSELYIYIVNKLTVHCIVWRKFEFVIPMASYLNRRV